jgi:hypothetical protein
MEMKKERLLVEYKRLDKARPAALIVTVLDLPESTTVPDYLQRRWQKLTPFRLTSTETVQIDNRPLERYTFVGQENQEQRVREVVVLRRQQRAYLFTGTYAAADNKGKSEIRAAMASLVCNW